jgi:hypothetical protein
LIPLINALGDWHEELQRDRRSKLVAARVAQAR